MTFEVNPKEFGALAANVETLLKNQTAIQAHLEIHERELRKDLSDHNDGLFARMDILFSKINAISRDGCAIGTQHDKDVAALKLKLKELEERPSKLVGIGAVIITVAVLILTTVSGFLMWLHGKLS